MSAKQQPPSHLADSGQALWADIVGKYDLRPDELRTLEDACAATDLLDDLSKAWREAGRPFMSKGSMGQEVEHPLIGSMDKQRKARQTFLSKLKLPDEPGEGGEKPRSTAARAAAQSRWTKGGA
jgi:hypothetical protein